VKDARAQRVRGGLLGGRRRARAPTGVGLVEQHQQRVTAAATVLALGAHLAAQERCELLRADHISLGVREQLLEHREGREEDLWNFVHCGDGDNLPDCGDDVGWSTNGIGEVCGQVRQRLPADAPVVALECVVDHGAEDSVEQRPVGTSLLPVFLEGGQWDNLLCWRVRVRVRGVQGRKRAQLAPRLR